MRPKDLIFETVKNLGGQEAQVLELLYGLGGKRPTPRQEVAGLIGCRPAAVDAIATRAVRKLRHPSLFKRMVKALEEAENEIWSFLGGPEHLLFKDEVTEEFEEHLPGEYQVAITVRYKFLGEWLAQHTCEAPQAWYRGSYSCEDLLRVVDRIESVHHEVRLPIPLQSLSLILQVNLELLVLAIRLAGHSSITKGYFVKSHSGIRIGRAVELHRMFSFTYRQEPVSLGRLVQDYNEFCPSDRIGPDEMEIALSTKPHLFLQLGDMGWTGIGLIDEDWSHIECGAPPTPSEVDGRILRHLAHREPPGPDSAEIIRKILSGGPCHVSRIIPPFIEEAGANRSPKVLNTVLKGSEELIALAPEIFALRRHLSDPTIMEAAGSMLLSLRQCRLYTLARFAGEPMDAYPLWGPSMEMRMCQWAENTDAPKLFQSLMAVADPVSWDVPEAFRKLWIFKKQWFSGDRLSQEIKEAVWLRRPRFRHLLAAALCAKNLGYINWLRINDIVKPQLYLQIYDHDAAALLALLIALGVVEPADHWQKPHPTGRGVDSLASELSNELHRKGHLRWKDGVGMELLNRLKQACQGEDLGWVQARKLQNLVSVLEGEEMGEEAENEYDGAEEGERPKHTPPVNIPVQLRLPFGPAH
jgi:hypothetical protein